MTTKQQKQALEYFRQNAEDWKRKADSGPQDEVNIIKQRNDYVIGVVENRRKTKLVLDIGCGTGELVCDIAKMGINAIGVDFAEEMIRIAKANARKFHVSKATFEKCSIFEYPIKTNEYDVISANGLIEYISYKELDALLELCLKALKPGGSLVLGSRNRLFNAFTSNKFTEEEINKKNINLLLLEAIAIVKSNDIKDLIGLKTAPLQKEEMKHQETGINVSTRYQFTPAQLINMLNDKGFEPIDIYPIHIHGVLPGFKEKYPSIHTNISNLLQNYGQNMSLIPQASSFMIHVKRK